MNPISRRITCLFGLSLALAATSTVAQSQSAFPSRPIKILVPTPAGGASDAAARLVAQAIGKSLGQQVVVENKPGANGLLAVQAALAAPADGYTLLWTLSSMAGIPMLVKGSPIKTLGEFTPVSQVIHLNYGVFTHPSVPVNTLAELTAHLKANPDKLNFATGTLGEYMAAAHYLQATGTKAINVPYKGGAQLMPDLVSGRVQINVGPLAVGLPHVQAGKLKLLAVFPQRSGVVPEVLSMAEAGVPTGNIPSWNGLMAPPGTPRDLATRVAAEVALALNNPSLRSTLETQGFQVAGSSTPQAMGEAVESATLAWRNFVRDYDIPQE